MIDKSFGDIAIGESSSFSHHISENDIENFSRLSGDKNPLHMDEEYAKKTKFHGRLAHGMFLAALVSRLLGMYLPGKRCLLLSQELRFKIPARIGDVIQISGTVSSKSQATKIVEITIEIKKNSEIIAEGTVKTQIL